MKNLIFVIVFSFAVNSSAMGAGPGAGTVYVVPTNDVEAYRNLNSDRVKVKSSSELIQSKEKNTIIRPDIRDQRLNQIGLAKSVEKLDDLDRDLLLYNLYHFGPARAHEKYPKISLALLTAASAKLDEPAPTK